jgi:hypothetical protein
MKNAKKYACGCVVTNRKGKLSIFPVCKHKKCDVRDVVRRTATSKTATLLLTVLCHDNLVSRKRPLF